MKLNNDVSIYVSRMPFHDEVEDPTFYVTNFLMFLDKAGEKSEILVRYLKSDKKEERSFLKQWVKQNKVDHLVTIVEEIIQSDKATYELCRNNICIASSFDELFVHDQFDKWDRLSGVIEEGMFTGFHIPFIDDKLDLQNKENNYLPIKIHHKNLMDLPEKFGRTMPRCSLDDSETFIQDLVSGVYTVKCESPEQLNKLKTYGLFRVNGNILETV